LVYDKEWWPTITILRHTLVTKYALSSTETLLPPRAFIRTHRSFMVAIAHIEAYSPTELIADSRSIPVGRQYRETVMNILEALTND